MDSRVLFWGRWPAGGLVGPKQNKGRDSVSPNRNCRRDTSMIFGGILAETAEQTDIFFK